MEQPVLSEFGEGNNSELAQLIASARVRLRDKLLKLNIKSLGISEYNERYLGNKIAILNASLGIYENLLRLTFQNSPVAMQHAVFVDYGGGSGLMSALAKEMGVGTVIYNDLYDVSCNDVKILSSALKAPLDHIVCGDVDDLISFVRANSITVNAIASYDVLEHIYDVRSHFKKLASISDSQFRVVYASGANIKNPRSVRTQTKRQHEAEYKNRQKQWGHKDRDSLQAYFDVRKDMIAAYKPDLNNEQLEFLAQATRGLIKHDIEKCIDEYLNKGSITYQPDHPTNTCDPHTGNWCEHLMSHKWLQHVVTDAGFSVKISTGNYFVSGSLFKKAFKLICNAILLLGSRAMFIAPYYVVLANRCAEKNTASETQKTASADT